MVNICTFPHILGSPFSYRYCLTLQLIPSEFPYIWENFLFFFISVKSGRQVHGQYGPLINRYEWKNCRVMFPALIAPTRGGTRNKLVSLLWGGSERGGRSHVFPAAQYLSNQRNPPHHFLRPLLCVYFPTYLLVQND